MKDPRIKKPENTQDRFSPEYMAYLKELEAMAPDTNAGQVAKLARNGRLESSVMKQLRETLRDPNKMEKKEYKYFMKAVGEGKFPKKGKQALRFLQALEGTPKEKEYAGEFFRRLSEESTSPLTERTEKDALKKLTDLRDEDLAELAIDETSAATTSITQSADFRSQIDKASETKHMNWEMEKAPEELIKELDNLEIAQAEIAEKSNELDRQYLIAKAAAKPDKNLIARLRDELQKLDYEFEEFQQKLKKPRQKYQNYIARNLERMRALDGFFKSSGVDIKTAEKLRLSLMDMHINPSTGKAGKKADYFKITGVRFDKSDREGMEDDAPGELLIEYENELGEAKVEGYKNFLQMLNVFDGHEEIDSLAVLNKKSADEFGYKDLSSGQEFETETLTGFDKEHKPLTQKRHFKIEAIDEAKKTIILDQTVTKIPRQWLENSVDESLYLDHRQKEFSYGEFAKFIKQHRFKRKFAPGEIAEVCAAARTKSKEEKKDLSKDASPALKARFERIGGTKVAEFDPPKAGEQKEVLYVDTNKSLHWGRIAQDKDGTFTLEDIPDNFRKGDAGMENLLEIGVPEYFAATQRAATNSENKKLGPSELAAMVREGSIMNAPATRQQSGGKWVLNEQPGKIAAMNIDNKDLEDETEDEDMPAASHKTEKSSAAKAEPPVEHPVDHPADHADAHDAHDAHGGKKNYYEEALPMDQVRKYGGMEHHEHSIIKNVWNETRLLSLNDLWQMGKSMWEFYNRRFERQQKDRFARVGEEIPYFSPEMRRIVEATEHEEVHQYQEAFEHKGIYEIQYRLENTSNKDEFKAAFVTLTEKGQLRWDSIPLWRNINKFITGHGVPIPIPTNGDPNTRVDAKNKRTGFDYLKGAIDSIWGESTYDGFFSKNKSAYASNSKGFFEEGDQLEGVDGGHELRLSILLQQHKQGIYVNPHEYEGLILHSIDKGKSNMQAKLYFMLEGVAAANSDGRYILPYDRMAHINSMMLPQFPILEYLTARAPRGPDGKESYRFTLDDYKSWVRMFDNGDSANPAYCKPNKKVDEFLWNYVIPSDNTQTRINKAIRNGEKLDHDDMFAYLPPASYGVVDGACKATTGSKKFLTIEGYANVFPGFSQYMISLSRRGLRSKLKEAIKSYVRFEGIMTNRYKKSASANDPYARMDERTLGKKTVVSDTPPQAFINQINPAVKSIAMAYDNIDLINMVDIIYQPEVENIYSEEGKERQQKMNEAFDNFNKLFDRVVKTDNGEKMEMVIKGSHFTGMPDFLSGEEKDKRKAAFTDQNAID